MKACFITIFLVFGSLGVVLNGCNDANFPVAVVNEPDITSETYLVSLESSAIYPSLAAAGEDIVVRRGAGVFPSGFYRVTFSGGAMSEFFWSSSSSEVTITVPYGAISGPFGFTVGAAPSNGGYYSGAIANEFKAYTVKAPGLIVKQEINNSF